MVRSLKGTVRQSSPLAASGPVAGQAPEIQPSQPAATPSAPAPAIVEPLQNDEEEEQATPDDPETEAVALAVQPPAVMTTQPNPVKSASAAPAAAVPNAGRPLPNVAAAVRRTEPLAPPLWRPVVSPRPAGVARAVTRTATIPLVAIPRSESWESMMRVSLPPPSAALEKPSAAVVVDPPPPASGKAARPSGWGDILVGSSSAVLGFIGELWLRAFPGLAAEVA